MSWHIDPTDVRPLSAFDRRPVDPAALAGGVLAAVLVPGTIVAVAAIFAAATAALATVGDDAPAITERNVVHAEFVKLGEPLDPNRLPDRQVPLKTTAPDDKVVVSDSPDDPEAPPPDAGVEPPAHAEVDDLLRNLEESAHKFAELDEERKREGDPDGIREGTAKEAKAGDIYVGKLYVFFRRGWTVPSTLSDAERRELTTDVDVKIAPDLSIADFRVRTESGTPLFDQSVLDHLGNLQRSNVNLPEPPVEIEDEYLGRWIGLRFRGRDAS
jgi:hypothetical protein